jgi:dTDP-4-amino-4,6-dideoxygalactose transaminase
MKVPFNHPAVVGRELANLREALDQAHLSGDGTFTRRSHELLREAVGGARVLLTHSCTGALEMAAMLADVGPGDEVIMPSFTFVSTANAFALRGAKCVFVDIRPDTLNLDESLVAEAVTPRTRAIVPVHYAGVACEMDTLLEIARRDELLVIEDAAQGFGATYRGRPLGAIGQLGALSFHATKNVVSGEGGALVVGDGRFGTRAEIVREKGTNRSSFFRGEVDKYTWVDVGSSYLPSELVAAFLAAQLEHWRDITRRRRAIWQTYHEGFAELEAAGVVRRPIVPADCEHNGHLYYLLLPSLDVRTRVLDALKAQGIHAVFHYVPLDTAPAARRFARTHGTLTVTHDIADRLVRLPLWLGVEDEQPRIIDTIVQTVLQEAAVSQV